MCPTWRSVWVLLTALALLGGHLPAAAEGGPENVLLVVNKRSRDSREIAEYYVRRRGVPASNVCRIGTPAEERISRDVFEHDIAGAVMKCLKAQDLREKILYIVTTSGVPLGISGGKGRQTTGASVDSELTMLYSRMAGEKYELAGPLRNPLFGRPRKEFTHEDYPIYLVTRLTGYTVDDVKAMIDRGLEARNEGIVVLDMKSDAANDVGNNWMEEAVRALPRERVRVDRSEEVLTGLTSVIGYASWGSNDRARRSQKLRWPGMQWLPGAIATEYVSTDGRSFEEPPEDWTIGEWGDKPGYHASSPQSMTGDFIREGATGASGHVGEPYLTFTPRPGILFPAYLGGRNLAESFYLSIPAVSWMNVIVGDPLCRLR